MCTSQPMRRALSYAASVGCLGTLVWANGCVVGPQPDPPPVAPIELSLVSVGAAEVSGEAGAVTDPRGLLWVFDVTSLGNDPLRAPVRADGSFGPVPLDPPAAGPFIVQHFDGAQWSEPVLFTRDGSGGAVEVTDARSDCLTVESYLEQSTTVSSVDMVDALVTNMCADDLRVEMLTLISIENQWGISSTPPVPVPSGGSATLDFVFGPDLPGEIEDVIEVEFEAPGGNFTRYIVLRGQGI